MGKRVYVSFSEIGSEVFLSDYNKILAPFLSQKGYDIVRSIDFAPCNSNNLDEVRVRIIRESDLVLFYLAGMVGKTIPLEFIEAERREKQIYVYSLLDRRELSICAGAFSKLSESHGVRIYKRLHDLQRSIESL